MRALLAARAFLGNVFYGRALLFDVGLSLLLTGAVALWTLHTKGFCDLDAFLENDGTGIYAGLLSAWAALLGFAITAITIVSALVSLPEFSVFRGGRHYDDFWFAFVWTIRVLGIAAGVSLLALVLNHYPTVRNEVFFINVALAVAAALSLFRSGRTLEVLLKKSRAVQPGNTLTDPEAYPPVEP